MQEPTLRMEYRTEDRCKWCNTKLGQPLAKIYQDCWKIQSIYHSIGEYSYSNDLQPSTDWEEDVLFFVDLTPPITLPMIITDNKNTKIKLRFFVLLLNLAMISSL